eukprot:TRINITY_DN60365_c0_g1_i1.p1 TRINITY_DN60365_c0_g1~~TRINITY_DN60365_c0_g1_i1.p1  ORF type:complete len:389 (+),score=129.89 TRINITY_DN60365_c0_g1_i1:132-1169(+)
MSQVWQLLRARGPTLFGAGAALGLGHYSAGHIWGDEPLTKTFSFDTGATYEYEAWPGPSAALMGGNSGAMQSRYERDRPISHQDWDKPEVKPCFSPSEFRRFPLEWAKPLTHDTKILRFALPSMHRRMGLDVASCIVTRCKDEKGGEVIRPYTPISQDYQNGFFDILVKKYPSGKMGGYMHGLQPGEYLDVKGPYQKLSIKHNEYHHLGMVAGGTGITPMYQIIINLLKDPRDRTNISLVYANNSKKDVLLIKELMELATLHRRFKLYLTVLDADRDWSGGIGYVNPDMLSAYMPKPGDASAKVLVCGPPGMMDAVSGKPDKSGQGELKGMLKDMGYSSSEVYKF